MLSNLAEQQRVGKTIRAFRRRRGLSIERLAERAKMSSKHLGAVERGQVDVGLGALRQVCAALAVDITEVLGVENLAADTPQRLIAKAVRLLAEAERLLGKTR